MSEKNIILQVPDIGESEKIELIRWTIKEGEAFEEGDEICDFVTDKAVFTLDAPRAGVLVRYMEPEKSLVLTGQEIAEITLSSS